MLTEGSDANEFVTIFIPNADMVADAFTKYLSYPVWRRLMNYVLNLLGKFKYMWILRLSLL